MLADATFRQAHFVDRDRSNRSCTVEQNTAVVKRPCQDNRIRMDAHLWFSLDGHYWFGGKSSLNGVENPLTLEKSSRIGGTASIPVSKHQALKFSYNNRDYIRYEGNYQSVSVAWQYSWLGRPQ